jgi:alkylation response protein AidB-like acyl-CoA dehydrogenase
MSYRAPVRDLSFALTEIAGVDRLFQTEAFAGLDLATVQAVLEGAGDFAENVLAPLNRPGDLHGARFKDGKVTAAPGFADAMRQFAAGGWSGLSARPEHGGQGLPKVLQLAVFEMLNAANMAFALCPTLSQGAIEALQTHGSERQKRLYLEPLISGAFTGAMDLTEPQAGSDLAALATRAEPVGDGTYRLYGQKIFITWGDHDCADNIVHLVLARLPDAPEGSRGISLFLAAKRLVNEDGTLGEPNALQPGGIEHKLGIHASPTCVMLYEGARAELVGEPHHGLAAMFTMMNSARVAVGVQGVGIAERAYQQALGYALERRQGRSAWSGEPGAPIFDHPDVRRMLAALKAKIEAARALCLLTALNADLAEASADPEERAAARAREETLTPIIKAWSTDLGVEAASQGIQIHGGLGFIEETGAAQHLRDARIAPIYEGTNGIQAGDLVSRKLALAGGAGVSALLQETFSTAAALTAAADDRLEPIARRLHAAAEAAEQATQWIVGRRGHADALAGATAYLKLMGDTLAGWALARGALAAAAGHCPDPVYAEARIGLAAHYADTTLAQVPAQLSAVCAGADGLKALAPAALASC